MVQNIRLIIIGVLLILIFSQETVAGYVPLPAPGASGNILTSNGAKWTSGAPGLSNPMDSAGDFIYGGASGVATKLDSGSSGQLLTSGGAGAPTWTNSASGTGTGATCTAVTNVDSCSTAELNYIRLGAIVTGAFYVTIDPTTAAAVVVRITPPIASALTSSDQVTGVCVSASGLGYLRILGSAANDNIEVEGNAAATSATVYTCSFTYRVL